MEDPGALEALYTVIQYYDVHSCYRGGDDMKIHFVPLPSKNINVSRWSMVLQSPLHPFKGTVQRDGSG
jgi:hypothetical protein